MAQKCLVCKKEIKEEDWLYQIVYGQADLVGLEDGSIVFEPSEEVGYIHQNCFTLK